MILDLVQIYPTQVLKEYNYFPLKKLYFKVEGIKSDKNKRRKTKFYFVCFFVCIYLYTCSYMFVYVYLKMNVYFLERERDYY